MGLKSVNCQIFFYRWIRGQVLVRGRKNILLYPPSYRLVRPCLANLANLVYYTKIGSIVDSLPPQSMDKRVEGTLVEQGDMTESVRFAAVPSLAPRDGICNDPARLRFIGVRIRSHLESFDFVFRMTRPTPLRAL